MTRLTAEITADGKSVTIDLSNGCWTVESAGEQVDSCDAAGSMPSLDEVVDDPEQIEQLLQSLQAAFDDYDQPGLIVERVDGKWFFSPMATGSEQLLAVIRALSREEIEDLQQQVMDLSGSFETWPVPAGDAEASTTPGAGGRRPGGGLTGRGRRNRGRRATGSTQIDPMPGSTTSTTACCRLAGGSAGEDAVEGLLVDGAEQRLHLAGRRRRRQGPVGPGRRSARTPGLGHR